jgi:tetratricopeptide (TPR) repeat protein
VLAKSLDPVTAAEELFAALDKALELNPRCEDAFDLRARSLARLNRFEEALAQCHPPSLQPTPAQLLVRAAWIEAERGNLAKAVSGLQSALAEHPDFYGGWQLLSEWEARSGRLNEAAQAAEKMAALAPLQPVPLGYLGDLKLRLNDRQAALAAFQRAFTLDPNYEYAGFQLFRLQMKEADPGAAAGTLQVLRRRGETHKTLACSVELELAKDNTGGAIEGFDELCRRKDAEEWTLHQAAEALRHHDQENATESVIQRRLAAPDCTPALAAYWVARHVTRGRWWLHRQLATLPVESRRQAVLRYLDELGETYDRTRRQLDVASPLTLRLHLWLLMRKHRAWLQQDLDGWGKVGYVLTNMRRHKRAINWLGDWRSRPNAESWMLHNLIVMLQRAGRYEETLEVIRHAVALRHGESFYEEFRLWAAFEESLAGNPDQAEAHLANLPAEVKEHLKPVRSMAELLVTLQRHPPADNREARRLVRAGLLKAFPAAPPCRCQAYAREGYRRLVKAVAARSGSLGLWPSWFYRGRLGARRLGS